MKRRGREGEVERGREMKKGRRGVEMRKGILIGGMLLGLLMGCNNGGEERLAAEKRLGEIGRSTENVFYSFIDLIADTLGFRVTAETTKQQVGQHFTDLGKQLEKASNGLEEVAKKAEIGDDKSDSSKNLIKEAVEAAKTTLSTLKKHLDSLKDIGGGDSSLVGEVRSDNKQGVAADPGELKKVYDALKGIVTTANKEGVKELKGSTLNLEEASIGGGANPENGAKVLAVGAVAGSAVAPGAAAIVSSVSGEAMLDAIVKSQESDASGKGVASTANGETTAVAFAKGGTHSNVTHTSSKAAAVAGGIALRSLVKDGKLAAHTANSDEKAVQAVGITAVNKLLVALEDIIKKTVKKVLDKAKVEIDKVKASKTTVKQ